jgi:hypothetical protein
MKLDHWKNYAPIAGVAAFDAKAVGPVSTDVQIIANTHASDAYPDARIGFVITGLGSVMLTAEHSADLRAHLERAERDIRAGGPRVSSASGAEGCCERCSRPIRIGELIYAYEDVSVHAGPCSSETRGDG